MISESDPHGLIALIYMSYGADVLHFAAIWIIINVYGIFAVRAASQAVSDRL
jgi:hypothetical protein